MNFGFLKTIWNIDFLIGLSVFISSYIFFKEPFEGYFHYIIFLMLLPYFIMRYGFERLPFYFLAIPTLLGLINIIFENVSIFPFIKIFGGMLLSVTFYNYVFIHYQRDFAKIFSIYLHGIVFCCYLGLLQLVSYNIGFQFGYNFSWIFNKWGFVKGSLAGIRVNSIFSEPAQFALMLLPAIFIVLNNFIQRKFEILNFRQSILILVLLILTGSSTGYLGLFVALVILAVHYGRLFNLMAISMIAIAGAYFLYYNVDEFQYRVDSMVNLWTKEEYTIEDINSSSFVLYNNLQVAWQSFTSNFLFGTGLGSFPEVYEKYSMTKAEDFIIKSGFDFNSQDGNSLFIRTMAETGIAGVLFWVFFIPRFFIKRVVSDKGDNNWIISSACLVLIIGYLLRQGNYFLNAFPMFVLMYYYMNVEYRRGLIKNGF